MTSRYLFSVIVTEASFLFDHRFRAEVDDVRASVRVSAVSFRVMQSATGMERARSSRKWNRLAFTFADVIRHQNMDTLAHWSVLSNFLIRFTLDEPHAAIVNGNLVKSYL